MGKNIQQKMLRGRKIFGRCSVEGHGDWCEVSRDMQETAITRAQEKREVNKEIEGELHEFYDGRCNCGRINTNPSYHRYDCPAYEDFDYEAYEEGLIDLFCDVFFDGEYYE